MPCTRAATPFESRRAPWYCSILLALCALVAACGAGSDDCTCRIEQAGERRTLACGETACISGILVSCTDEDAGEERGACMTAPAPSPTAEVPPPIETPPASDPSCDDLYAFCTTRCRSPSSASSDCQATVIAGDPSRCASWTLTNGVLCRP